MPKYSDKAKYCDTDVGALHLERTAPLPLSGRLLVTAVECILFFFVNTLNPKCYSMSTP